MTTAMRAEVAGVGYEGQTIEAFVSALERQGVQRLVDVRLTPLSRKRGFSKSALIQALATAGIAYEHRRELGNPKHNRAGFAGSDADRSQARAVFAELLRRPEAVEAIDAVAAAAAREQVVVLCFEADQHRCHRDLVLAELTQRAVTGRGSRRRAR
ncbi:MAG: DUF488 domain-containing protein [Actinobacteria bacterium]|nr:MAG: DUF488 domain-containing protein [Actinomycetota bacterium]